MSLQVLGDVQLVTRQEVECMIEAGSVSEDALREGLAEQGKAAERGDELLRQQLAGLEAKADARHEELDGKIGDEAEIRDRRDKGLEALIRTETSDRRQGDTAVLEALAELKEYESEAYPNAFAEKIRGLPIAFLTVTNGDKSLSVGDTLATVDERFFPRRAVDFHMYAEQVGDGGSETWLLLLRLDNSGNVNVINKVKVAEGLSATDVATVLYLTEQREG